MLTRLVGIVQIGAGRLLRLGQRVLGISPGLGNQSGALIAGIAQLSLHVHPGLLFFQKGVARHIATLGQSFVICRALGGQAQRIPIALYLIIQAGLLGLEIPKLIRQLAHRRFPPIHRGAQTGRGRQSRCAQPIHRLNEGQGACGLQAGFERSIGSLGLVRIGGTGIELHQHVTRPDLLPITHMQCAN